MALTPKELKSLKDLTKKRVEMEKMITEETTKAAEKTGKAYEAHKKYLKSKGEELKLLKKQEKSAKTISDSAEELIEIGDQYAAKQYDIAASQEKQKKLARAMKKLQQDNSKMSDKQYKTAAKKFSTQQDILKTNQEIASETQIQNDLQDKLLGNLGLSVGAMSSMVAQARLFVKAMFKNPIILMLASLVAVVKILGMGVKQAFDFQDELGTSANQSIRLAKDLTMVNTTLSVLGIDGTKIAGELANNLGGVGAVTEENVKYFGLMSKSLGVSSETGIQVFKAMESISSAGEAGAKATLEFTAALAESNNVAPGAIMNDIAANTEMFAEFGLDGGKNIAKAAVQARKLGLNLATTAKIADSLLDFESSIEKEMEASMLIGKQLNYNKARELALSGDIAGAAADVVKQIGGKAELEKMNVLQRRALADSIGVSVDELSKLAGGKMEVKDADKDIKQQQKNVQEKLANATDTAQVVMKALIIALGVLTTAVIANTAAQFMGFKGFGGKGMMKGLKKGGAKLAGKAGLAVAGKKALTKKGGGAVMKATGKKVYGAAAKTAVKKGTAKIAGKAVMKGALKKIPILGAVAGLGFGFSRLMKGDWAGALGEVASGAASIIPGLGTAASLAIDAGLAARDISKANKDATEDMTTMVDEASSNVAVATADTDGQQLIEEKVSLQDEQDGDTFRRMLEIQGMSADSMKEYQEKSVILLQQIIDANNQTGVKVEGLTKE
jgi:hypothetical protein